MMDKINSLLKDQKTTKLPNFKQGDRIKVYVSIIEACLSIEIYITIAYRCGELEVKIG